MLGRHGARGMAGGSVRGGGTAGRGVLWPMVAALVLAVVLAMTAGSSSAASAEGPSLAELKERFAERYPRIRARKQRGTLGETWEGYVAAVKQAGRGADGADEGLRALIEAENLDRTRLYRIVAEREETEPAHVARRNAIRNFQRAEPGWYLRGRNGEWFRKPGGKPS